MSKALLLSYIVFISIQYIAQTNISGKVTDEQTGSVIPGASVTIKGEKTGTF